MLGFIFAPARRQVSAEIARLCIEAAREAANRAVVAVGVFVDASGAEIRQTASEAGLDMVQLNGLAPPDLLESLRIPASVALRPRGDTLLDAIHSEIDGLLMGPRPPVAFLVDSYSEYAAGGTGERADWGLAAEINAIAPVLLAGGLNPENVSEAIRQVRPRGVDVSSGVEVDGVKNVERIGAFVRTAREAFAALE